MPRCVALGFLLILGSCQQLFPFAPRRSVDGGGADLATDLRIAADGPPRCSATGQKIVQIKRSSAGNWSVALEPKTTYTPLPAVGPPLFEAVASVDHNVSGSQVAGFIVSRPALLDDIDTIVATMIAAISRDMTLGASLRSVGRGVTTHDGYPAVVDTTFRIAPPIASSLSKLRNLIVNIALGKLTRGWPPAWGVASKHLVLRITTVLRQGRRILLGALTDADADADGAKRTQVIARDLTSTTGLAVKAAIPVAACEKKTVTRPLAPVDIIWVMDESGSMLNQRTAIAASASTFFYLAQTNGLDFRMGVTSVCSPRTRNCAQGKFCSTISTVAAHDGGEDRFLLRSERSIFEACIKNPPGFEGGAEYGLQNAMEAVKTHLPRAANAPGKIRRGAQIVIITVTDEIANELTTNLIASDRKKCSLPVASQGKVNARIRATVDYLNGSTDPEATLSAYDVIAGTCTSSCNPDVAYGYRELAAALGGTVHDICARNLGLTVTKIIGAIKATASSVALVGTPIGTSLDVALDGKPIARNQTQGFDYDPARRTIRFLGTTMPKKGSAVTARYLRWR